MQTIRILTRIRNLSRCVVPKTHFSRSQTPTLCKTPVRSVDPISRLAFSTQIDDEPVDAATFERVCDETLESLTEYFEHIVEETDNFQLGDVSYSSGVLTVFLGPLYGTYVINRQSPNRQIWLSSPVSGPKRYDFVVGENTWVYKHDGLSLHHLLQNELSLIANDVDFGKCAYSKL